jgi:hypothetical protein
MPEGEPRTIVHRVDGDDVLRYVDDAWVEFALENDAPKLTRERVLGRSLYDFIQGSDVRHVTALLLGRVRSHQTTVNVPVRCDSPTMRRFIDLALVPMHAVTVEFRSRIEREETRDAVELLDETIDRSEEFVRICSWCKRVLVEDRGWQEIEVAVEALDLFDATPLPQLTHGICETCLASLQSARG